MKRFLAALLLSLAVAIPARAAGVVFNLQGTITQDVASSVDRMLSTAEQLRASAILVVIDSPGGEVDAGRRIAIALEQSKIPVTCVVDGAAASMAFYVLQSCRLRLATERSALMTHESFNFIPFSGGEGIVLHLDDLERMASETRVLIAALAGHNASRLNISLDEYKKRTRGADWNMTPADAVEVGALDAVVPSISALSPN